MGIDTIPLLISRAVRVGETAVIAGWGLDQNKAGGTLRAGQTTISAIHDFIETTFDTSAGVCQGDSGGALLVNERGVWALCRSFLPTCPTQGGCSAQVARDFSPASRRVARM